MSNNRKRVYLAKSKAIREEAVTRVGVQGRKTGLQRAKVNKDSQGFDDIGEAFAPTPAKENEEAAYTTPKPGRKVGAKRAATRTATPIDNQVESEAKGVEDNDADSVDSELDTSNGKVIKHLCLVRVPGAKVETKIPVAVSGPGKMHFLKDSKVKGTKMIDALTFSCGMLEFPVGAGKPLEGVRTEEIYYIMESPPNGLVVQIQNSVFNLSRGDTFRIPKGNKYRIENVSQEVIRTYFVIMNE